MYLEGENLLETYVFISLLTKNSCRKRWPSVFFNLILFLRSKSLYIRIYTVRCGYSATVNSFWCFDPWTSALTLCCGVVCLCRDFMDPTMDSTKHILNYLMPILEQVDPELHDFMRRYDRFGVNGVKLVYFKVAVHKLGAVFKKKKKTLYSELFFFYQIKFTSQCYNNNNKKNPEQLCNRTKYHVRFALKRLEIRSINWVSSLYIMHIYISWVLMRVKL